MLLIVCLAALAGAVVFCALFIIMGLKGNSVKLPAIGLGACCLVVAVVTVLVVLGIGVPDGGTADEEKEPVKQSETSNPDAGKSIPPSDDTTADGQSEPGAPDGDYIHAPKVIYTTTAEENGYGEINMYVDGLVGRTITYEGVDAYEVTTSEGKIAISSIPLLTPLSEWEKMEEGKEARIYFQYLGYSSVIDEAMGILIKIGEPDADALPDPDGSYVSGTPVDSDPNNSGDSVWSEKFTPINDFMYSLDKTNKTITLRRYMGHNTKIRLSPVYTIDGTNYSLASLGDTACFLGDISITSIYIPEGVTFIGGNTFNSCTSLKYLYIPSTVDSLESSFFDYLHDFAAYCDSSTNLPGERDMNDYEDTSGDYSTASELGSSMGGAVNGFLAGLLGGSDDPIVTEIYYGGTEEQWRSISK